MITKLLSLLAVLLFVLALAFHADAAITYFGSSSNPDDGSNNKDNPTIIVPPASMTAGQLVVIHARARATSGTIAISETGGQAWVSETQQNNTTASTLTRVFWCRFNGTWTANPSVNMGTANNNTVTMHVFSPTSSLYGWAVDAAESRANYTAPGSPYTVTITGITTQTNGALVFASWASIDRNEWDSLTGGWSTPGSAQYRNNQGNPSTSTTYAYKVQATAGATGNVSKNQLTYGGDAGTWHIIAFKETPPPDYSEGFGISTFDLGTCGSAPCWTSTPGTGTVTSGFLRGEKRLKVVSTGTNSAYAELNHGSVSPDTYKCIYFETTGTNFSDLASAQFKSIIGGYQGAGGTNYSYILQAYNNGSAKVLRLGYYANGNQVDTTTYNLQNTKYLKACMKYSVTNGSVGWTLHDADGVERVNRNITGLTNMRTGVQYWAFGVSGSSSAGATVYFDGFNVNSVEYEAEPFTFGTCNSTSSATNTADTCTEGSLYRYTCDSDSVFDFGISTNWNGAYNVCGITADTRGPFPGGTNVTTYNRYSFETTSNYAPPEERVKALVDFFQGLTPSRKIKYYNNTYASTPIITDGSEEAVQFLGMYRTGTDTPTYLSKQSEKAASQGVYNVCQGFAYPYWATRFQAGSTFVTNKAELYLSRAGTPGGTVIARLYSDNSGSVGTLIESSDAVATGTIGGGESVITFPGLEAMIVQGRYYWIGIYSTVSVCDGSNYINWHYTDGAVKSIQKSANGSSWISESTTKTLKYELYSLDEDTDNGHYIFVFPPRFKTSGRTDRYPTMVLKTGTGVGVDQALFDPGSALDDHKSAFFKLIAQSTDNCDTAGGKECGVIGVISNTGGSGSQGWNEEYLDSFAAMISHLYTNYYADKDRVILTGTSRGGGSSMLVTANPKSADYTVIGTFAAAPPIAFGLHGQIEDTNYFEIQTHYPVLTGYLTWPDTSLAYSTWQYDSAIPPHCKIAAGCDVTSPYSIVPLIFSVLGTDDPAAADECTAPSICSPIGYCSNTTECQAHFGNDTKTLVFAVGSQDSIIPYHALLSFDDKLRDAGINHKTCLYMRGGHAGESLRCVIDELENYVGNYIAKDITPPTPPDGREYWLTERRTHNPADVSYYGNEAGGIDLPATFIVPAVLDNSISGTGPYGGAQQPAEIYVIGKNSQSWEIRLLNSSHYCLKKWYGTNGNSTIYRKTGAGTGDDCTTSDSSTTCSHYGDEWCVISNIQFGCSSPPCTYYWGFYSDGIQLDSTNTPFMTLVTKNDNFNRADNQSLGTDWYEGVNDYLSISSNTVRNTNLGTHGIARYATPVAFPNQYAKIKITTAGTGNTSNCVMLRSKSSGGYRYGVCQVGTNVVWGRYNWNVYNDTLYSSALTLASSDTMGVTIQGTWTNTKVSVWKNPTNNSPVDMDSWDSVSDDADLVFTDTSSKLLVNAANSGNYIGIIQYVPPSGGNTPYLDDFYGGPIGDVGKEAYTKVQDTQPTRDAILTEISGDPTYKINMGISMLFHNYYLVEDTISITDSAFKMLVQYLSDVMAMSDSVYRGKDITLTDAVALLDSILSNKNLSVEDAVALLDSVYKLLTVFVDDSVDITDDVLVGKFYEILDTLSLADSILANKTVIASEFVGLADSIIVDKQMIISEGIEAVDNVLANKTLTLDDLIAIAEAVEVAKFMLREVNDSISLTDGVLADKVLFVADIADLLDSVLRDRDMFLGDSAGIYDSILTDKSLSLDDELGVVDSVYRDKDFTLGDSVAILDYIYRNKSFSISDEVAMADSIYRDKVLTILETVGLIDSILADKLLTATDLIALADSVERLGEILKEVLDTMGISDSALINKTMTISDLIGVIDSILTDKTLPVDDQIILTDIVAALKTLMVSDSVDIVESILRDKTFTLTETIQMLEIILADKTLTVNDLITLADSVEKIGEILKEVLDTMSISDAVLADKDITIPDIIALADSVLTHKILNVADQTALADAVATLKAFIILDQVEITDEVEIAKTAIKEILDSIAMTDAVLVHKALNIADTLALQEIASTIFRELIVTDQVDIIDLVLALKTMVVTDQMSIDDAVELLGQIIIILGQEVPPRSFTETVKPRSFESIVPGRPR